MGLDLFWRPKDAGDRIPRDLKVALESAGWHWPMEVHVRSMEDGILEGMRIAGIAGAAEVVMALRNNGTIVLEAR